MAQSFDAYCIALILRGCGFWEAWLDGESRMRPTWGFHLRFSLNPFHLTIIPRVPTYLFVPTPSRVYEENRPSSAATSRAAPPELCFRWVRERGRALTVSIIGHLSHFAITSSRNRKAIRGLKGGTCIIWALLSPEYLINPRCCTLT